MSGVKKIGKHTVKEIINGFYRCDYCGYVYARSENLTEEDKEDENFKAEELMHRVFHRELQKDKIKFGNENVMTYEEMVEYAKNIFQNLSEFQNYDFTYVVDTEEWLKIFSVLIKKIEKIDISACSKKEASGFSSNLSMMKRAIKEVEKNDSGYHLYINLGTALLKLYKFVESFCVKNNGDIKNCKCLSDITTQIECIGDSILLQETNKYNVDTILMDFVRFEFTRSLRLYDFCNRNHPKFEDYYVLLWNTQRFINIIGEYMTKSQISYYIDENKANRMLTPSNIDNAPFYFGRMFLKAAIGKYKDLSSLDKLVGKLDFVERDSSYVDRIGIDEYRLEIEEWMEKERMYEKIQKVKKFD